MCQTECPSRNGFANASLLQHTFASIESLSLVPLLLFSGSLGVKKVEVEKTYAGDPFLVTVADYDANFADVPAYDDYGIVYNDRLQVSLALSVGIVPRLCPARRGISSSGTFSAMRLSVCRLLPTVPGSSGQKASTSRSEYKSGKRLATGRRCPRARAPSSPEGSNTQRESARCCELGPGSGVRLPARNSEWRSLLLTTAACVAFLRSGPVGGGAPSPQLLDYSRDPSMFDDIRGGIMVRPSSTLAGTTGGGKMVDFSINADSTVWVCK